MPLSDQWSLATGEENGKMLICRIRLQAPGFATRSTFPRLLVVLWPFNSPNGLPIPEDLERMTELEGLLQAPLEETRQGFLSVIVTGNGLREWQWYVRDAKSTMELVNRTLGELQPFPVQFSFQDDPDWAVYGRFLDLTGSVQGGL
jgi:hypothetical protein